MGGMAVNKLVGKRVFGVKGRELGQVTGLVVDPGQWVVTHLEVKLRRALLDELALKTPLLGSQVVTVPTGQISGVADSIVLSVELGAATLLGGDAKDADG